MFGHYRFPTAAAPSVKEKPRARSPSPPPRAASPETKEGGIDDLETDSADLDAAGSAELNEVGSGDEEDDVETKEKEKTPRSRSPSPRPTKEESPKEDPAAATAGWRRKP